MNDNSVSWFPYTKVINGHFLGPTEPEAKEQAAHESNETRSQMLSYWQQKCVG